MNIKLQLPFHGKPIGLLTVKRDMSLVRLILLRIEEHAGTANDIDLTFDGYSDPEVQYHLGRMGEAGLIKVVNATTFQGEAYVPLRLQWAGHDFLDAARNETVWRKFQNKYADVPFELAIELLKDMLKEHLGLGG